MSRISEKVWELKRGLECCTTDRSCDECPCQQFGLECEQELKMAVLRFLREEAEPLLMLKETVDTLWGARGVRQSRRARWEKDRCGDWRCTHCGEYVPDKGMQPWFAPWCLACGFAMEGPEDEKPV